MDINSVLAEDLCCILKENTKNEIMFSLINLISAKLGLNEKEKENLVRDIFYREQLMSTGIGLGIGIPHIRYEGVSKPVMAVGIKKDGIPDYESIGTEKVKVVVMIIVGKQQHKEHIRLLSQVVGLLKKTDIKQKLLSAESGREIYELITGHADESDLK
jgi:mannitol/fructose-specific phosphotransferase system IIA component (Ntr-type)